MRKRVPDPAHSRSLMQASEAEMNFIEKIKPTTEAASTIIRGIYECFRRLGAALLLIQGLEGDHEQSIAELTKLIVPTKRPLLVLENLRKLCHDINYRGYIPSQADLEDVLSIQKACWAPILKEVKKTIQK